MHKNNFDFLRIVFATLVLITHSYTLSGITENDFLIQLTHGQLSCSSLGVKGFFIISGYLILESAIRSKNWGDYMIKRILRIYPALLTVLLAGILIGLIVTEESSRQYLSDKATWTYLTTNLSLFFPLQYQIDNVFAGNPYKYAINGSLWTIPYEFLFYILLSAAFFIRKSPRLLKIVFISSYVILLALTIKYENARDLWLLPSGYEVHMIAHFGLCFLGGSVLSLIRIKDFKYKNITLLLALCLVILFFVTRSFYFTQFVLLPIIVIIAGTYSTKWISGLNSKIGDFSYGVYLYGFLVQQTIMHYFALNHLQLMFTAIPITFIMGALSWHLIEKRALALKRFFP